MGNCEDKGCQRESGHAGMHMARSLGFDNAEVVDEWGDMPHRRGGVVKRAMTTLADICAGAFLASALVEGHVAMIVAASAVVVLSLVTSAKEGA